MLLIIVGGLVIAFLMGFVVPKFSSVYEGTGADLPWMSQMMLQWGTLISQHGETMLAILVGMVIGLVVLFKTPAMRQAMIRSIWRIPAVGARLQLYQLARFYRTMGMLLAGGTPIMTAIDSLGGLLDTSMALSLQQAQTMISQGQPLSHAFKTAGMTTPIGERMLLVGERGGNVAQMMDSIAGFYDEELARWIDWFTKLFEPLLMLFIGLVIGVVVLLLYMPIFELAGQIQ
jgi:general secretion pathway protein F